MYVGKEKYLGVKLQSYFRPPREKVLVISESSCDQLLENCLSRVYFLEFEKTLVTRKVFSSRLKSSSAQSNLNFKGLRLILAV